MTAKPTGLIFDSRFLEHDTGLALVSATVPADSVWEPQPHAASPHLVGRAYRLLGRTGVLARLAEFPAREATIAELERVHTPEHVRHIRDVCLAGGGEAGEFAPASPETYPVARLAAGGALAGVDAVLSGAARNVYGLLRPPGHHAMPDRAMGFCYFNNVAIAARYAQDRHGLRRVAILDWDVHHGNGTQTAFYDDPSVLFISLHQDDWYPTGMGAVEQTGVGEGAGFTINVPLPPGTGNAGYLAAIERIVAPALRRFAPELLIVSAGQDPSGVDPLARMAVSADGFRTMATMTAELADEICGGRLLACHEGGYSEGYAPVCTWAVVEGLSGIRTPYEDPYDAWLGGMPCGVEVGPAGAAIDRAIATHGAQWGLG
ncbi:MAG: class II histone deacetylase [Thermomicrobiales bacterium]|nr:class II histone deacetylase [Thermomicrobiales bacterium]